MLAGAARDPRIMCEWSNPLLDFSRINTDVFMGLKEHARLSRAFGNLVNGVSDPMLKLLNAGTLS